MAAIVDRSSLFSLVFAILGLISSLCLIDAQNDDFSVELIHRDSPKSPLYNPSETTYNRVTNAMRRSFNLVHRLKPSFVSKMAAQPDIIPLRGEYLMSISIGTPSVNIIGFADTGSDLIWTQCKPCSRCFDQDNPLFDPSQSSTYKIFPCSSNQCEGNIYKGACSGDESCQYSFTYGDGSSTSGDLAADTLTLPSLTGLPISVPNIVIGCGHNNDFAVQDKNPSITGNGLVVPVKSSGIIGLGGGNLSLISQLGTSIEGKFSYCLVPFWQTGKSSKMNFGSNAIVSGNGSISTPMTTRPPPMSYYFLTLKAISVGSTRIKFNGSALGTNNDNIVIDSGTTLTLLPNIFYSELESAVSSQIQGTRVQGPSGFNLCYDAQSMVEDTIPDVTIHFTDADVKLQHLNTFVMVNDTISCFSFAGNKYNYSVYGNLAQMNFLVGYDTKNQILSFKPTNCSNNNNNNNNSGEAKKNGAANIFILGGLNIMKNVIFSLLFYYLI
ncbi:hypothetical protein PTKIN_Ptkin01aG0389000 [Pterospermum kingtungense]